MLPHKHLIYGTIFFGIIYFLFPSLGELNIFIAWISSWLIIDLDHYLRFLIKTKSLNPLKFWKWSMQQKNKWKEIKDKKDYKLPIFIFHGIEFLGLIFIFSFIWPILIWVFYGFCFHLVFDFYHLVKKSIPVYSKTSPVYTWQKNKNKKEL